MVVILFFLILLVFSMHVSMSVTRGFMSFCLWHLFVLLSLRSRRSCIIVSRIHCLLSRSYSS